MVTTWSTEYLPGTFNIVILPFKHAGGDNNPKFIKLLFSCLQVYSDGTVRFISHRQCIGEVKIWFYHHLLLKNPMN